jgi:hypothetical protein
MQFARPALRTEEKQRWRAEQWRAFGWKFFPVGLEDVAPRVSGPADASFRIDKTTKHYSCSGTPSFIPAQLMSLGSTN